MTSISRIEQEYNEIEKRNGWLSLFQEIREKCEKEAKEKLFSISESGKNQNRSLNRYRDVNPYDHSRIIIHRGKVDYINANLVKMERADRKYILTQGPLKETIGHFWAMIWEQNTKAILMLNKLLEKKQVKCHMYWPEKIGEEYILDLNDVGLQVEYLKCEEYTNFSKRTFKLIDAETKKFREVIQFHYTTWPDFGIPSSPVAFLQFLKQVRDSGALDPDVGPAVVHCSAGIGRSGTFCLVDCCLVLIEKEGENKVSVQEVLYELRRYRMGLIQTADQLYFSYQAIIEGIKLLKDPSFIDYEEVPVIPKEEEHHRIDETPPPLPPRTHSLHSSGSSGTVTVGLKNVYKPLPPIPASESVHENLISNLNEINGNNNVDTETNVYVDDVNNSNISNRPLPPLPRQNSSLEQVNESDNSDLDYDDDDDDDISDDDDKKNINDSEENMYETDNEDVTNENNSKLTSKELEISKKEKLDDSKELTTLQNGGENISGNENNIEVRRRKRIERQAGIERKVNEIKRKQREYEESEKSSKKRRSLITFITAGFIIGVIVGVYVYSKI